MRIIKVKKVNVLFNKGNKRESDVKKLKSIW